MSSCSSLSSASPDSSASLTHFGLEVKRPARSVNPKRTIIVGVLRRQKAVFLRSQGAAFFVEAGGGGSKGGGGRRGGGRRLCGGRGRVFNRDWWWPFLRRRGAVCVATTDSHGDS